MTRVLAIFLDMMLVAMACATLIAGTMYDTIGTQSEHMAGYINSNSAPGSDSD